MMENRHNFSFSIFIIGIFICITSVSQDSENIIKTKTLDIVPGWSGNSVNATIFRKNSIVSHKGYQYVAFYDSTSHVVLAKRKLKSNLWEIEKTAFTGNINDAHNSICIMVDGDGYLHMAWDHHNNQLHYSVGIEPGSLQMGPEKPMIGRNESVVSYPEFYRLKNGNLIFAYRDGGSGNGNMVLNLYCIKNKNWERLQDNLIDGESKRNAYWQIYIQENVVYISWVWRESPDVASNHDMCFAKSNDGGKTWVNSKDEPYTIPIKINTAETIWQIPQNSNLINQTSMTADNKGRPYIATYFKAKDDSCTQFYLLYFEGNKWNASKVSSRTLDFNLGGIGSRSIPVSRPQIISKKSFPGKLKLCIIYRDEELGNCIVLAEGIRLKGKFSWQSFLISDYKVGRWEPSFDTELWKEKQQLHLYVQKVGQGQAETTVSMQSQIVKVLEVNW